jgi:hypothetical protein
VLLKSVLCNGEVAGISVRYKLISEYYRDDIYVFRDGM